MSDSCVILMQFERERPARWAVHVANALLAACPQQPGMARRWTLQVAVDVYGELVAPIDVTADDGFFQRLCFAYALRYPHVPFSVKAAYEGDGGAYFESTAARVEGGEARLTQYVRCRTDAGERYESRWADWAAEDGAFRLKDSGAQA